jgi:hypothetical protein
MRQFWTATRALAVLLALGSVTVPTLAATITLAQGGQPTATIVIPAQANALEKRAGADLRSYVRAICRVELPLHTDGQAVPGAGLYVGQCAPTRPEDLPDPKLNPETFALHVRDGSVFLTGRHPTPTYFAAAAFLELLGVRWFAPGALWEYIPRGTPGELSVEVKDTVSVPTTSPRVWSGHSWTADWKDWSLRNRAVLSEVVPRRQFQNYLHRVFPVETYGQSHPEYYPLVNGKRWLPSPGDTHWRPCESNPEVIRLTVEYARKYFDGDPNRDSFSVGMDDIANLCGCPNCRAWDPRPDSYEKGEFSDRHYKFVNAVAREVAKTHPDRYIGTLIYSIARDLPETVDKLEPNVFGYITETSALWWNPQIKAADQELTRQWARRCRHLSRYDYYGFGCFTPRYYPHIMAAQLRFDKSVGMEGMYTENYSVLANTAPMFYAYAKLSWDHRQDVDRLLDEFMQGMFGHAAKPMKQYFALLERAYLTPRPGRSGWEHRRVTQMALTMSGADVDRGFQLLDEAAAQAGNRQVRERIAVVRAGLQYGSYVIKARELSQELQTMPITSAAQAEAALAKLRHLSQLSAEREAFWQAALARQDLLGDSLRGLQGMGYLETGKISQVEAGATAASLRLAEWYGRQDPAQARAALAKLGAGSDGSTTLSVLGGWLWVAENRPPNLIQNGGFEAAGTNQQAAEKDWSTTDAPPGWSQWTSSAGTQFALRGGQGRSGSTAATITHGGSAVYLQSVPAKAGERFLVRAWVRGTPEGQPFGGALAVRLRDAKGAWHSRADMEVEVEPQADQSGWQPLLLAVTCPPDTGHIVVMLSGRGQGEGVTAYYDDVEVYRLP